MLSPRSVISRACQCRAGLVPSTMIWVPPRVIFRWRGSWSVPPLRWFMSAQRSCLRRALPYSCRCLRLCCSPAPCMRMVWPTAATRLPAALIAAMLGLPWLFWQGWQFGIVALGLLGVLRFAIGRWFVRRLGGYTGDCLGFAQQIFELAIYLVAAAWNLF